MHTGSDSDPTRGRERDAAEADDHGDAWSAVAARAPRGSDIPDATAVAPARMQGRHHRTHRRRRSVRRRRRIWGGVGAVILLALVVAGGAGLLFVREVGDVRDSLAGAQAGLGELTADVKAGDEAKIRRTADSISGSVASAARTVDGPLWGLAAAVPGVGRNIDAVQRVTRAVRILTDRALQPGLQVMTTMNVDRLTLAGGGIDLAPFTKAQASVPAIASAFRAAQAQIAPIDQAGLLPAVAGPVGQVVSVIDAATPRLQFVRNNLATLLDIAGARGKKTYLVIFQNNAESRATGGNPAASMVLTVDEGRLQAVDQATSTTLAAAASGAQFTTLPAATTKLYRATFPRYSQDFTMSPDFPTTATLFQNLFTRTTGQRLDGVVSVDPVVLSHMLAVAGPVRLKDGQTVTAGNAVKLLLSDAYAKYPTGEQSDAFFADVSQRVFTHLLSTRWDASRMLDALTSSVREQRLYLNFTDAKAQAIAAELGVDGALTTSSVDRTTVGMYLNDSSVGKLEYYLTTSVSVQCDVRARTVTQTMTLHNGAPADLAGGYVLGQRNVRQGIPRTTMMLDVLSFAPAGGEITAVDPKTGRVAAWDRGGTEKGNPAVSRTVFVPAGETTTVSSTVKLPAGKSGPLNLRHTPTARDTTVTTTPSCAVLFASPAG